VQKVSREIVMLSCMGISFFIGLEGNSFFWLGKFRIEFEQ